MALPFPEDEFPIVLTPPGNGKKFRGTMALKTDDGKKYVEITLKHPNATGKAEVTYVNSTHPKRADLTGADGGSITVTLTGADHSSTWKFTSIAVFRTDPALIFYSDVWLFSDSLKITHDTNTSPYSMTGLPKKVSEPTTMRFAIKRNEIEIGTLRAEIWKVNPTITFVPLGTKDKIEVESDGPDIKWTFNRDVYTGFRCLTGVTGNKPKHSYAGTVPRPVGLGTLADDDWEATLIYPLTVRNKSVAETPLGFSFPSQSFRMVIAPSSSFSRGLNYRGTIRLGFLNGLPAVTIQSGSSAPQTVPVTYDASHSGYGVINDFSMDIGGATWKFSQITVFKSANKNYLATYHLTIDDGPFSMTGLPLPVKQPHFRPYPVFQNHVNIGTLTIISDSKGKFQSVAPGPPADVDILDEYLVWKHNNEEFFGFLFIVGLRYTPQTVIPEFGYLGISDSPAKTDDDWEASLIGPLLIDENPVE